MLVAKLVTVTLVTRVVVEANATDEDIMAEAKSNYQTKIDNDELIENLVEIRDDEECPYED